MYKRQIDKSVIDKYFTNTVSRIGGITLQDIENDVNELHSAAYDPLGLETDVTYGCEPKSMSRSVACAPSTTTFLSSSSALCKSVIVSHTYGSSCAA